VVVQAAKQTVAAAVSANHRAAIIPDPKSCRLMRISDRPDFERTFWK
jgi:hypothetical protein